MSKKLVVASSETFIVGHDPYTGEDILKTGERVNRRLPSVNVN